MWTILAITLLCCSNALTNVIAAPKFETIHIHGDSVEVNLEENSQGGYNLILYQNEEPSAVLAHIGRTFANNEDVEQNLESNEAFVNFGNNRNLTFSAGEIEGGYKISVSWKAPNDQRLEDCFDLGDKHWYGGPQQKRQYWPIEQLTLAEYSYVPKELDNSAIMEPYFLNSEGQYIYVQPQVPLFLDENNLLANHICLVAKTDSPYSSSRTHNELTYDFIIQENVRVAHQHAVDNYLGKPTGIPNAGMIEQPIWSTWAKFFRPINQTLLMGFANEIIDNGFGGQFEIDDLWEVCYGSLTVDENKFPDMAGFVQDLKNLGFSRVTIWVHPFINLGCDPWYTEALENGYFVTNEQGSVTTTWWNHNNTDSAYIDFTNPAAANWWAERLRTIQAQYGFDSYKFDAGEASWAPEVSILQTEDVNLQPKQLVENYVRLCAEFGDLIEVRTGTRTQDLPVFVRIVDKDSYWTFENGLPTLVTTLLEMNLNGYPLVLPDMIGGNGYEDDRPDKELFLRWLQATTFMPALQYSIVPFDFDDEAIEISLKFTNLHAEYADEIINAMNAAVSDGTPVNAPIWWIAPTDTEALAIWDQFLLGENILVAPVMEQGAVSRNIYLPAGTWFAEGDREREYEGGQWIENYSAPLDTLPYFTRDETSSSTIISGTSFTIFLAILNFLYAMQ